MNGCPHSFSFALLVSPVASAPRRRPLLFLFSFLTAPVLPPLRPLLLRHPHYYSLSGILLFLFLSLCLSLLTERFHRRRFFSGTRRRLPFVLVSHPLFHGRSSYEERARVALPLSPRERINDECFTLSPEVGPFAFARERERAHAVCFAIIHYVFCTFCDPFLFPRFYQRASFSTNDFPSLASSDRT